MPSTLLDALYSPNNPIKSLLLVLNFINGKTEAQRGRVTCPKLQSLGSRRIHIQSCLVSEPMLSLFYFRLNDIIYFLIIN